jgi:hypothetical protein
MDALETSWPCPRCSHPADKHGYDGVCAKCERQKHPGAECCTFALLYPAAALMPFHDTVLEFSVPAGETTTRL